VYRDLASRSLRVSFHREFFILGKSLNCSAAFYRFGRSSDQRRVTRIPPRFPLHEPDLTGHPCLCKAGTDLALYRKLSRVPPGPAFQVETRLSDSSRFVTAKIIPRRNFSSFFLLFPQRRKTPTNARRLVAKQLHIAA